jgi:3-oxoacid CoA-transferase
MVTSTDTLLQDGEIPVRINPSGGAPLEGGKKREVRDFNGKRYLMETALPGDVAIIRAWKADTTGNCVFRRTTRAFGPLMAKAAKLTIVEAENIVPVGEIDPDDVHLPGIFVDRVVKATVEKEVESMVLREAESEVKAKDAKGNPGLERKRRIAKRASDELKEGYYVNLGVGIPTMAACFVPKERTVWLQSENGLLGMGPHPTLEEVDA